MKTFLKIIAVFIIGIAGGIFAEQILWPYLSKNPFFSQYLSPVSNPAQLPSKVVEKREIIIEENTALQDAVEKVERVVVGIKTKTRTGKTIYGSGLIVTSDGLVITLAELVPQGESFAFFIDGETPKYQILKRDLKNNLALVKIEGADFQTCGFADFGKTRLGERVFLLGTVFQEVNRPSKTVNEGIVKFFNDEYIQTNIFEKNNLRGSPLFNIRGELIGLNTIDEEERVFSIPITKIRDFIGL